MAKKCINCTWYDASRRICRILGKEVVDPDNPPCSLGSLSRDNSSLKPTSVETSLSRILSKTSPSPTTATKYTDSTTTLETSSIAPPPKPTFPLKKTLLMYAPTGIPELDRVLGGGFLRGKTYLIAGETGCGKTIFSMQFLLKGAALGEPGIYLAIDEPSEHVKRGLRLFGWDVSELEEEGLLLFLDMRTHFSKIYLREERRKIEPKYIIESIISNIKKIRAKRLVIDPIAPLIYGGSPSDVVYVREFVREIVFSLERLGTVTTIMTSEIPTGSSQLSRFGVEEFLASGIIVLSLEEIAGKIYRVMYIRKARWAPVQPCKYVFEIRSGVGIVILGPLEKFKRAAASIY